MDNDDDDMMLKRSTVSTFLLMNEVIQVDGRNCEFVTRR